MFTGNIVNSCLPVIKDMERDKLLGGGTERREFPAMSAGITVTRSILFSSANLQAAFSANIFEIG